MATDSILDQAGRCHQLADSPTAMLAVNLIKDFSLDYMHLVCWRVVRRMLHYFKGCFKGINSGKLSLQQLTKLPEKLTQLYGNFPSEFPRQPRSLTKLARWEVTELRSFLLFPSPVILQSILLCAMWKHFLSLSIAMRILCVDDRRLRNSNLSPARQLLEYSVLNVNEHYGETFYVFDIHSGSGVVVLDVSGDVEYFQGSLDELEAFQFESYLEKFKRLLGGKDKPLTQIVQ